MKLAQFFKRYNQLLIPLSLCIGASFIFLFRLGMPTLQAWDEAWYGTVAQTIIKSHNWVFLKWGGEPFMDHPPMGMWLMALSYIVFGVTEFSTRLPSALAGIFTILFVYLTGVHLYKKRSIGVAAAVIVATSVWYVLRVRSGNLDALLAFFFVATFYSSIRSKDESIWFPISMLFFGCLMMTKALVGISMIPVVVFLNWRHIFFRKSWIYIVIGLLVFASVVVPWYHAQFSHYSNFFDYHFKNIGLRNQNIWSYFNIQPKQPLYYLHMGVRKWYYLWVVALVYSSLSLRWKSAKTASVFLWFGCMLFPFFGSERTELWHLIPVYLPLSLITSSGLYYMGNDIRRFIVSVKNRGIRPVIIFLSQKNVNILYVSIFLFIGLFQLYKFYPEVYPQYPYISDIVDVGKNAKIYARGKLYLNESFLPVIAFYSGRDTYSAGDIIDFWKSNESADTSTIVGKWGIDRLKNENIHFKTLYHNSSYFIIMH
ncbi:MAG: glycosyltransferase family 39 protein [Candidatus Roizmanbacteria bacterium]|nr:glycosyltransferase family 39 protein [Candidatus Roizmanbacteria bacterium]